MTDFEVVNLNLKLYNSTNVPVPFSATEVFRSLLIENSKDYSVAVTRVQVPSTLIQTFIMNDKTQFFFSIRDSNTNTLTITNYSFYMPDANDNNFGSTSYGSITYFSNNSVIFQINRIMYQAYAAMIKSFNSSYAYASNSTTLTGSNSASWTKTLAVTNTPNFQIAHIQFLITNFAIYEDSAHTIPLRAHFSLILTAPDGTTVNMMTFKHSSLFNGTSSYSCTLSEESFQSINKGYSGSTNAVFYPNETFIKLYGKSINGTWTVTVQSDIATYGSLNFNLLIFGSPSNYPVSPPSISMDSNGIISLYYEQRWASNGITLAVSPFLKTIMDFGFSNMNYNSTYSDWEILFPDEIYSSTQTTILVLTQNESSRRNLSTLRRLLIKSYNLATQVEYTTNLAAQNVLTDFTINTDVNDLGDLTYSETAGIVPWRRYKILTNIGIREYDYSIYVEHANGFTDPVLIAPGQQGLLRITFFKDN